MKTTLNVLSVKSSVLTHSISSPTHFPLSCHIMFLPTFPSLVSITSWAFTPPWRSLAATEGLCEDGRVLCLRVCDISPYDLWKWIKKCSSVPRFPQSVQHVKPYRPTASLLFICFSFEGETEEGETDRQRDGRSLHDVCNQTRPVQRGRLIWSVRMWMFVRDRQRYVTTIY